MFVADEQPGGMRYSMRLGNRHYPHMKLRIEPSPDASRYLFRCDSHDRHVCPPETSPEHKAFRDLMEKNQQVVEGVEAAWAAEGVPTFKSYLREDLERRRKGPEGRPAIETPTSNPPSLPTRARRARRMRRPHARSRGAAVLAVLLGAVLTLCVRGYRFGESNHAVYLVDALRRTDPSLLQNDWWARSTLQYHFAFNALTAGLIAPRNP